MLIIGVILLVAGFLAIVPSGQIPGSSSVRNIRIGGTFLSRTPGRRTSADPETRWKLIIIGLFLILVGLALIAQST